MRWLKSVKISLWSVLLLTTLMVMLSACDDGSCALREMQGKECDIESESDEDSLVDREAPEVTISSHEEDTKVANTESQIELSGSVADLGGAGVSVVMASTGNPTAYTVTDSHITTLEQFISDEAVLGPLRNQVGNEFGSANELLDVIEDQAGQRPTEEVMNLLLLITRNNAVILELDSQAGTFQGNVNIGEGDNEIELLSIDRAGNIRTQTQMVQRNRKPTVELGEDRLVGRGKLTVNAKGEDADGDDVTFSWDVTTEPSDIGATGTPSEDTSQFSMTLSQQGVYYIKATPNDGIDDGDTVTLKVTVINNPPICDPILDQFHRSASGNFVTNVFGSAIDPDGDDLTLSWDVKGPGAELNPQLQSTILANKDTEVLEMTMLFAGNYEVTFRASDSFSECAAKADVQLDLAGTTANAGPDQVFITGRRCRQAVTFSDNGSSDNFGLDLEYTWTITQPDGEFVSLANPNQTSVSFEADQCGVYTGILMVKGGKYAFDEVNARIINQPPVAVLSAPSGFSTSKPQKLDIELDASGSYEPDAGLGDRITEYSFTVLKPSGETYTVSGSSSKVSLPKFAHNELGEYTISLRVSDGHTEGNSTTTLTMSNNPPTAVALGVPPIRVLPRLWPLPIPVPQPFVLNGSASTDPDGDELTYKWEVSTQIADPLLSGDTAATAIMIAALPGIYTAKLTVSDGQESATAEFIITAL